MTTQRTSLALGAAATAIAVSYFAVARVIPSVAAAALLHPSRRTVTAGPPAGCVDAAFGGAGGVALNGWRCRPAGEPRATLVFLHGIGDNRLSVAGAIDRFTMRGLEVVAYDSRAQGGCGALRPIAYFSRLAKSACTPHPARRISLHRR